MACISRHFGILCIQLPVLEGQTAAQFIDFLAPHLLNLAACWSAELGVFEQGNLQTVLQTSPPGPELENPDLCYVGPWKTRLGLVDVMRFSEGVVSKGLTPSSPHYLRTLQWKASGSSEIQWWRSIWAQAWAEQQHCPHTSDPELAQVSSGCHGLRFHTCESAGTLETLDPLPSTFPPFCLIRHDRTPLLQSQMDYKAEDNVH